ncbi:hypothetical protein EV383_4294 [Pseudonocardia sediminis]|uniref:Uncharacterized protein n=1 Tax=Pseudonocardia sediminis TaxID=1397368 RepID=A0A4Q7V1N4_PSEST|nr:hypothetical protein [Pseudonocardia sediminis]RZT87374.1 hypothetical protein EV383_4294 [Pseudonocardia sediminis]
MGNSFGRTTDTRTTGAGTADDTRPIPAVTIPEQRSAPPRSPAPPRTDDPSDGAPATGVHYCRCGHDADAHEHFRAGSECATCDCARYRTTSGLAALLTFTTRRGR